MGKQRATAALSGKRPTFPNRPRLTQRRTSAAVSVSPLDTIPFDLSWDQDALVGWSHPLIKVIMHYLTDSAKACKGLLDRLALGAVIYDRRPSWRGCAYAGANRV